MNALVAFEPETAGLIAGYASRFNHVDQARDMVMAGAFRASLGRRLQGGVKMLWQHDPSQPIGLWSRLEEDEIGLRAVGRLNLSLQRARDVLALLEQGAIDGLSIGFRTQRARIDPRDGIRRLDRVDLWEVSLVTFPMLPEARIHAVGGLPPSFDTHFSQPKRMTA